MRNAELASADLGSTAKATWYLAVSMFALEPITCGAALVVSTSSAELESLALSLHRSTSDSAFLKLVLTSAGASP